MLNKTFSNTFKSCPNNKIGRNKKYFGLAAIFLVTWRVRIAYALCSFVVLIFKRQASGCELRQKRRVNFRTSCKKYKTILMLHNNLGKVLYCVLGRFMYAKFLFGRHPANKQMKLTTQEILKVLLRNISRVYSPARLSSTGHLVFSAFYSHLFFVSFLCKTQRLKSAQKVSSPPPGRKIKIQT